MVLEPVVIVEDARLTLTVGKAVTDKLVVPLPDPALLVQVIEYVRVPADAIVPVLALPLAPGEVTQLLVVPPAEHEVGLFVADQLTVAALPVLIEFGDTDIVTTGGDEAVPPEPTLSVVVALLLVPPAFVQVKL